MHILVTGATGTLGRAVVPALVRTGHSVRALSRESHPGQDVEWVWGDLAWGKGVHGAVRGVDAIIHLATSARKSHRADSVDIAGTQWLLDAATDAGVPHLVYVSIVGVDQAATGYLEDKLEAERLIRESGVGWTILRSTTFHQHLEELLHELAAYPAIPVDRSIPWQPVCTSEVAAYLIDLVAAGPERGVLEYGGPEVIGMDDVLKPWLQARHLRRLLLPMRYPGGRWAAQRAGWHTTDATPLGRISWRSHLFPDPPEPSDDFAIEHTASPTSPATQPDLDPNSHVYGGDEGYERPTRL
ncbi:NAD(P)H-binding protein [Nonomuraea sp. NPDC026600]|uniref:SDR family oxidoreductase n=1 Tax=Nonomuraea sp. NPDC026600 TaxID=3155363 RepID=UPI0033DD8A0D